MDVVKAGKTTIYNWFDSGLIPATELEALTAIGMDTTYVISGRRSKPVDGEHLSSEDIAYAMGSPQLQAEVIERGKKYGARLTVEEAVLLVRSGTYVWVPYYDLPLSAGGGAAVLNEAPKQWNFYTRSYIDSRGLHAADLAEFPVRGVSMRGVLDPGSSVLLDRSNVTIVGVDIYAAALGNDLVVKFMERLPDGSVRVSSKASDEYPPFVISAQDFESGHAKIIGRCISHRVDR